MPVCRAGWYEHAVRMLPIKMSARAPDLAPINRARRARAFYPELVNTEPAPLRRRTSRAGHPNHPQRARAPAPLVLHRLSAPFGAHDVVNEELAARRLQTRAQTQSSP